jgi:hypothetical protein
MNVSFIDLGLVFWGAPDKMSHLRRILETYINTFCFSVCIYIYNRPFNLRQFRGIMRILQYKPRVITVIILSLAVWAAVVLVDWNSSNGVADSRNISGRRLSSFSDAFLDRVDTQKLLTLATSAFGSTLTAGYTLVYDLDEEATSTQAKIVTSDATGEAVIVFQETEDIQDWLINFDSILESANFPGADDSIMLHSGFREAVLDNNVAQRLEEALLTLDPSGTPSVKITGHSLGGACAHIMGAYLAAKHSDLSVQVTTFGQPRVGNAAFKSWSESLDNLAVWRIVFKSDYVARVPYAFLGYDHAGHIVQINRLNSKAYYNHVGDETYEGVPDGWYYGNNVFHHKDKSYIRFFKNQARRSKYWPTSFKLKPTVPTCKWWQWWC